MGRRHRNPTTGAASAANGRRQSRNPDLRSRLKLLLQRGPGEEEPGLGPGTRWQRAGRETKPVQGRRRAHRGGVPSVRLAVGPVLVGFAVQAAGVRVGPLFRTGAARVVAVVRLLFRVAGAFLAAVGRLGHGYFPSSNTTSRLAESVVSPGATGADSMRASIATDFIIIGIGCWKPPPSLMLTMRRTRRPSDWAYIAARAWASFSASRRASSYTASGWSISKLGPWTWLAPLATSASSTSPRRAMSRTLSETVLLAW